MSYDYVVVGGGTAGCVLAARLSENQEHRVLLIEAGTGQVVPDVVDPTRWRNLLGTDVDWSFRSVPQTGLGGKILTLPAGRLLGGSSSINAMLFLRGHPANFDGWAASTAPGWSYHEMLPFFRRSEMAPGRDPEYRGTAGPMRPQKRTATDGSPVVRDLVAAASRTGYPLTDDLNGAQPDGVGWPDMNWVEGRRQSAADAYLHPVLGRGNLTVACNALAQRLLFADGRCCGVEWVQDGRANVTEVKAEVLVTAGAIGSAHLLMVSGIGPGEHLREFGLPVLADVPQVGLNLQDHAMTSVVYAPTAAALQYVRGRTTTAVALLRTRADVTEPDLQLVFVDAAYFSPSLNGPSDAYGIACSLMTPASRGSVRLSGRAIDTPPVVDPNYLGDPRDADRLTAGVRMARGIGAHQSMRQWSAGEIFPGSDRTDDDSLREYVRRSIMPHFHYSGTCRMGDDRDAVVDTSLRVRGVTGLRVADASVIPTIPSANTNATVLAIAERAANMIAGQTRGA